MAAHAPLQLSLAPSSECGSELLVQRFERSLSDLSQASSTLVGSECDGDDNDGSQSSTLAQDIVHHEAIGRIQTHESCDLHDGLVESVKKHRNSRHEVEQDLERSRQLTRDRLCSSYVLNDPAAD